MWNENLQLLLVVTPEWNSVDGVLYRYERDNSSQDWELIDNPVVIAVGKKGMAWGNGLVKLNTDSETLKTEGDLKTPAGIFSIGTVFGDRTNQSCCKKMPYLEITENLECVDDPKSAFYNQFVDPHSVTKDWSSSEKMSDYLSLYKLGFFINHNVDPVMPTHGSCIFAHIWSGPGEGTAGCTSMDENDLKTVVQWLDADKKPLLIQLPIEEVIRHQKQWQLPEMIYQ
ncbi:MAG: L,D-transpeptidase family protein [Parachlamydiales bacterium]|nr:L,D-transpeptidase family protein [Parachlamydiales bacterium]